MRLGADGEVVWSRHLDADANLATMLRIALGMVTKGPITKEITKETVKPSCGECRVYFGEPAVTTLVCFFISHTRLRARLSARHSPRPLW